MVAAVQIDERQTVVGSGRASPGGESPLVELERFLGHADVGVDDRHLFHDLGSVGSLSQRQAK